MRKELKDVAVDGTLASLRGGWDNPYFQDLIKTLNRQAQALAAQDVHAILTLKPLPDQRVAGRPPFEALAASAKAREVVDLLKKEALGPRPKSKAPCGRRACDQKALGSSFHAANPEGDAAPLAPLSTSQQNEHCVAGSCKPKKVPSPRSLDSLKRNLTVYSVPWPFADDLVKGVCRKRLCCVKGS